jgi:Dullard-like phosphatase family protein
MLNKSISPKH